MEQAELEEMAKEAGMKVDARWSVETLQKKLSEFTAPNSDEEVAADNTLAAMGEGTVEVIGMSERPVHLGDGTVLAKKKRMHLPESVAKFLEARDQLAIV